MFAKNIFRESVIYLSFFRRFNSILASDFLVMPLQLFSCWLSLSPSSFSGRSRGQRWGAEKSLRVVRAQTKPGHVFPLALPGFGHWPGISSRFCAGNGLDWNAPRPTPAEELLHSPSLTLLQAGGGSASLRLPKFPYPIPLIWQIFATCQNQEIGFDLDYSL